MGSIFSFFIYICQGLNYIHKINVFAMFLNIKEYFVEFWCLNISISGWKSSRECAVKSWGVRALV